MLQRLTFPSLRDGIRSVLGKQQTPPPHPPPAELEFQNFCKKNYSKRKQCFNVSPSPPSEMVSDRPLVRNRHHPPPPPLLLSWNFSHFCKKNYSKRKQCFNVSPSPPSEMVSDRPLERFIFGVAVETGNNEKG